MSVELTVVDNASAAADAAAALLVEAARAGGAVGLSGGSTPRIAYERAAALEADWSTATLWLVDERCVLPEDPLANTRLVRETILERVTSPPRFHEIATHVGVEGAADRYDALLRRDGVPPLLFLGVGSDGHTASLFPDAPSLAEG
jgi:6-phosphogluconolactonase